MIETYWVFISQLTLYTSVDGGPPKCRGGPFARGDTSTSPFSMTGDIRGIFGRTGDLLDAIGFCVNAPAPLSSYQKTNPIGGVSQDHGCTEFDDFKILASKNEKPFKITNMVINYGVYIKGLQVTYLTSNGTFVTLTHGTLNKTTGWKTALLIFEADEWITKANVAGQVPMVGPPSVVTIEA